MTNRKMRFYNHICCSNIASSVILLKLDISDFLSPLFFVNPAFSDLFFNLILHGVNPKSIVIGIFCFLTDLPVSNLEIGFAIYFFLVSDPNFMNDLALSQSWNRRLSLFIFWCQTQFYEGPELPQWFWLYCILLCKQCNSCFGWFLCRLD